MSTTASTASDLGSGSGDVQGYFDELMTWATAQLTGAEVLTGALSGEDGRRNLDAREKAVFDIAALEVGFP